MSVIPAHQRLRRSRSHRAARLTGGLLRLIAALSILAVADAHTAWAEASAAMVVVEFFTSQGCSSCPPAEEFVTVLGRAKELRGRLVVLAYHIDYWDRLGWRDPFSDAAWTRRQYAYARLFRASNVYTPQLVINGRAECSGNKRRSALSLINKALAEPSAATIVLRLFAAGPDSVDAQIRATVATDTGAARLHAAAIVFENGLTTEIERGENGGRQLTNDYVVRHVERAFEMAGQAGATGAGSVSLPMPAPWARERVGIAVMLQDPASGAIHAAGLIYPLGKALESAPTRTGDGQPPA